MCVRGSRILPCQLCIAVTAHCACATAVGSPCTATKSPRAKESALPQVSFRHLRRVKEEDKLVVPWFLPYCFQQPAVHELPDFISFSLVKHIWNLVTSESLWNPVNVAIIVEYQCQQIINSVTAKHSELYFFLLSLRCEPSPFVSYLRLQLPHFVLADMFNSLGCIVLNT